MTDVPDAPTGIPVGEPTAVPVPAVTVANLRDLGGIALPGAGAGVAVRPGALLRSAQLHTLDPAGDRRFAALGVRTIVDLRTAAERRASPDRVPPGARTVVADVLGDAAGGAPARLYRLFAHPRLTENVLGEAAIERAYTGVYRHMVLSGAAREAYRTLLVTAAEAAAHPLLFHCTAGKDRTGWGATLLLSLLGADRATAYAEFLAVNPAVRAAFAPYVETFIGAGGDPRVASVLIEVRAAYLDAAFAAVEETWGGVEAYVADGLGVPDAAVARLRERLTAPAGGGG